MSKEESKSIATDPFTMEGSRGWLEYGSPVSEKKSITKRTKSDDSHITLEAKELLEVSNEDIINLTKMTAQLPDRNTTGTSSTTTTSSSSNNSNTPKHHHHHHRMETKKERTFASAEHLPTIISTSELNNMNNNNPSPTRPSLSTPSPSNRNTHHNNNENRRSWYKHWMKRDKGKNRATTIDNNETSVSMVRDASHQSSSNNSSTMTTTLPKSDYNCESMDPTKQFMSAHHHPISVAFPKVGMDSNSDHPDYNRKISISSPIKLERTASTHRRTSSEAQQHRMGAMALSLSPNKKSNKFQAQRRHSLDSVQTKDIPLFSTPEFISNGDNNNILGSDVLHHNDTDLSDDNDFKKSEDIESNTSSIDIASAEEEEEGQEEEQEEEKRIMLDYDTLPSEVLSLLNEYEKQGKMQVEERRVKMYFKNDEEEEDEDDDIVDGHELISTVLYPYDHNEEGLDDNDSIMTKKIAIVRASRSDRVEFVKLVHLTDGHSMKNGKINRPEEIQSLLTKVDHKIETLQKLTQDAKQFMNDNKQAMDALTFDDEVHDFTWPTPVNSKGRQTSNTSIHSIKEAAAAKEKEEDIKKKPSAFSLHTQSSSSTTTSTLSSNISTSNRSQQQSRRPSSSTRHVPSSFLLDPHISDPHLPYNSVNPFDYRQEEVRLGVSALENEMSEFKNELKVTEELIRNIQIDINDTRQRMSSYIKDIPEAHYSALKKLEVDVESILANRAKNPWLDTGYALLSYLLTLFALLVWIIICGLKWGRTVILFPRKLWRTYTEYLIERDRAVKKASLRSVASGSNHNKNLDHMNTKSSLKKPSQPALSSTSYSHPHPFNNNNTTPTTLLSSSSSSSSAAAAGISSSSSSSTTTDPSSRPKSRIVHQHQ
ncbi:hypothetical protein INT45_004614 [Circinella minor]|uniref:Uncharacterized protein n=1 Tax=Circinella minor TaxID=1195481 RepID=A0A8H7S2H2_9FUNG|nr:hypothetical protein INT45_004614 [Circinella minor]